MPRARQDVTLVARPPAEQNAPRRAPVHDQDKFGRLLNRQLGGFCSREELMNVVRCAAELAA